MRKKIISKATPAIVAAAMVMSLAACGEDKPAENQPTDAATPTQAAQQNPDDGDGGEGDGGEEEDAEPYTVITDENGNPIDLGGMEIIIRDWFSDANTDFMQKDPDDLTSYQSDVREYREWAMEKYNFTLKQEKEGDWGKGDWGTAPQDFIDYVTTGGDDYNFVFVVRDDPAIATAMSQKQMYDLATLDCLDFTDPTYTANKMHEQYGYGGGIYAMYGGISEPRDGLYFNKKVLEDAGHTADEIYDMQKNDTWTWDAWTAIMDDVQQDKDGDGEVDFYGFTGNMGGYSSPCVFSNGGEFVGMENGKYVCKLEDANTIEGLEFAVSTIHDYYKPYPEGAEWDYYKQDFQAGKIAFLSEQEYAGTPGNFLEGCEFEVGFVMFPKGPHGKLVNKWSNNPAVIPACYDAQRAWNIAFAYNVWYDIPDDIEEENGFVSTARTGIFDARACDETLPMMSEAEHGMVSYDGMIPGLEMGPQLTWSVNGDAKVSELVEAAATQWKTFIDTANGN